MSSRKGKRKAPAGLIDFADPEADPEAAAAPTPKRTRRGAFDDPLPDKLPDPLGAGPACPPSPAISHASFAGSVAPSVAPSITGTVTPSIADPEQFAAALSMLQDSSGTFKKPAEVRKLIINEKVFLPCLICCEALPISSLCPSHVSPPPPPGRMMIRVLCKGCKRAVLEPTSGRCD